MSKSFITTDSPKKLTIDESLDADSSGPDDSANDATNFMTCDDAMSVKGDVELSPKKTIVYTDKRRSMISADQIDSKLREGEDLEVVVDPLYYDTSEEAAHKAKFSLSRYTEDCLITLLYPISSIYVYFMYG